MQQKTSVVLALVSLITVSCVSSKKFKSLDANYKTAQADLSKCQSDFATSKTSLEGNIATLKTENATLTKEKSDLTNQVAFLKENNTQALKQLEDMSVISKQQAESIKKSMENMGAKDSYIQTLQQQMARKDSLNMALVMNIKGVIGNLDDKDINVKIDKGVVIIDISDKMLFKSGSYDITEQAKEVLGKVAKVLKNQSNIEFMVEGHTDNVPYKGNKVLIDNWDLSVKRATTVIRLLQKQYGMDPAKMLAGGRSEYNPVASNDTPDGKSANRRTRIVILPELDQFFKLLEPPGGATTMKDN